jgi:hypothetical protein
MVSVNYMHLKSVHYNRLLRNYTKEYSKYVYNPPRNVDCGKAKN